MKIICLFNYASHYRKEIFLEIENALKCDFYFGDIDNYKIKKIDYSIFKNKVVELKTKTIFKNIIYYHKIFPIIFNGYDKIILTGEYYNLSTWFILLRNAVSSRKTYLWSHGWYGNENFLKKVIKKVYFSLSDGIFLYGNYSKNLMINEGFNEAKLHVIFNSLDYTKQLKIRKELKENSIFKNHFKNNNKTLIFVGRLTHVKKINILIEALRFNHYNLVIVGDGVEKKKLMNLVKKFNLTQRVWFYGETYKESELSNVIYNADLCVSPGNVGLTAIHSFSYGTPVITHSNFKNQMPEFEIIESGVTGAFFEENSIQSLNDCLVSWFELKKDSKLIKQKCFERLDMFYNPIFQINILKKVLL